MIIIKSLVIRSDDLHHSRCGSCPYIQDVVVFCSWHVRHIKIHNSINQWDLS